MPPEPAPYVHRVAVRYSDLDTNNHVNNAQFVHYLEEARLALIREYRVPRRGHVVARTEVDYVAAIRYEPQPLEVAIWVEKLGGRSVVLAYTISHCGVLRAKARVVLVMFDHSSQKTRSLSDDERDAYAPVLIPTATTAADAPV